jgi:outer membrane protein OmpA-like peptidoglycan-associated protein
MAIPPALRRCAVLGLLLLSGIVATVAVDAQTSRATIDGARHAPTAAEIAQALRPKDIRSLGPNAPKENGYVLVLTFATASAQLTAADKQALQEFGKAFKEYIPGVPVTIEGHADPRGTDQYNLDLSQQRARAVRDYLVDELGANPQQFEVVGFGKSRLKDTQNPMAEVNRRVEFVTKNE